MEYVHHYQSPLGDILLAADDMGLTGLWFAGQKYFARQLDREHEERQSPLFSAADIWLDAYFGGKDPGPVPRLHLKGTRFQNQVWHLLCDIPYGRTTTYGEIAEQLAVREGRAHMSAQAVGGAVGKNPVSIFVPCHRVVGTNGSLTGYAGGLDKKIWLLELEGADRKGLFRPKKGTAL